MPGAEVIPLTDDDAARSKAVFHRWAVVGVSVSVTGLLALTVLQYAMPLALHSCWGLNHAGVRHFQQHLSLGLVPKLSRGQFVLYFQLLAAVAWLGYAIAVVAASKGGLLRSRNVIGIAISVALLLAILWPASLSCDVYAYTAYARMQAFYGQNPYLLSPEVLRGYHDPSVSYISWKLPSSYGSVWTLFSMGLVMLLRAAGLWWQVAAMKLMEAAALIGAGLAGRAIANYYSPGRGDLALLAIGLNPLFLIEGPGNGHNDLLMMSLLLVGALLLLRKRFLLGSLVIGLSIGIKFVTLLALAWLLLEYVRGRKAGQKMSLTTAGLVIGVVPIALGYLPFWEGTATLTAPYAYLVWDENGSAGDSHIPFLQSHWQMFVVVLLMVLLTLWLLERKGGSRWPAAWSILTVCASFLVMPMSVPWYFIWPLAVSLTRWDLLHVGISVACLVLAFFSTLLYCLPG